MKTLEPTAHPDRQYLSLLKDIDFQPIFIMGTHRSGTTLLHQLLDATGSFNTVNPYLLIKRNEILSNYINRTQESIKQQIDEQFHQIGLTNRVFDKRAVGSDLAEEYGFVLKDSYWKAHMNPRNVGKFIEFCKKVQLVSDPKRALLLKSPWDYLNFMYVKRALPKAKFIFIHRHPLYIMNSQLNTMRSVLAAKNPYLDALIINGAYTQLFNNPVLLNACRLLFSSHFDLGVRILTLHLRRVTNYFLKHIDALPPTDTISIRYEDLCADAETTMSNILNFLALKPREIVAYNTFIEPRSLRLLPEVAQRRAQLGKKLQRYYAYNGYEI